MGNLAEFGRRWAQVRPTHPAVRFEDRDVSWEEFDRESDAIARGLAARGIGLGDRVGVLLANCHELPQIVIATLKLGAISVPLNVMLTARELAPIIMDAGCMVIVSGGDLVERLVSCVDSGVDVPIVTVDDSPGMDSLDVLKIQGGTFEIAELQDSAPAFICYTSGTTGVQKGATLTHGSVRPAAIAKAVTEGLTYRDRTLVPVALVYTGAMISCFIQISYFLGGTLVLDVDASAEHLLDVIERERISVMTGVPVVYERMAASPAFQDRDLSSLRSVNAGGAPVSPDLLRAFHDKGIAMLQSYGMTEVSGLASILNFSDSLERLGSAGRPILDTSISIQGPNGEPLSAGEVGEVCISGPHLMAGYWNNPQLTRETVLDGWIHSGDLGFLDADGFLTLVDRKKDMLISGGHNIYPAEIERALGSVSRLHELAVIGVPDDEWGEVPLLVAVSSSEPDDLLSEVRTVCAAHLARYKHPRHLVIRDEPLPRTVTGKVSKPTLRELYSPAPSSAISLR